MLGFETPHASNVDVDSIDRTMIRDFMASGAIAIPIGMAQIQAPLDSILITGEAILLEFTRSGLDCWVVSITCPTQKDIL